MAATVGGISLFFVEKLDAGRLWGNLVACLSGLTMACMFLSVQRADASERMSGLLLGHLLTAAVGIPFLFFTPNRLDGAAVGILAILGVVQLGVPYILFGLASEHCPPLACSLIAAVEPLLNPVWVALFDGEKPGALSLLGGAVVVLAITAWCAWKDRIERETRKGPAATG